VAMKPFNVTRNRIIFGAGTLISLSTLAYSIHHSLASRGYNLASENLSKLRARLHREPSALSKLLPPSAAERERRQQEGK